MAGSSNYQPVGDTFRLDQDGFGGAQNDNSVAVTALTDGGFAIAWIQYRTPELKYRVFARKFDADGNPVSDQVQLVGDGFQNGSSSFIAPSITALNGGGFAVEYTDFGNLGTVTATGERYSGWWPWIGTFSSSGTLIGETEPFGRPADRYAPSIQLSHIAADGEGGFHHASAASSNNSSTRNVVVNGVTIATGIASISDVDVTDFGNGYVASWTQRTNNNDDFMAKIVRPGFSDAIFRVSEASEGNQSSGQAASSLTSLSTGGFVASWTDGPSATWRARVFGADGQPVGTEIAIASSGSLGNFQPEVKALSGGRWIMTYNTNGLKAQVFDSAGAAVGDEWAIPFTQYSGQPVAITELNNGKVVVVGTDGAVFGRMFAVPAANHPPSAAAETASVTQRQIVSGNLITDAPVTDIDGPVTLSKIAFGSDVKAIAAGAEQVIAGRYGTLTIASDGKYHYKAGESSVKVGNTATDKFTYTAFDGTDTASATLTVSVTGSGTGNASSNVFYLTGSGTSASGGRGSDSYYVDGQNDTITELGNDGNDIDIVYASVDYTLAAGLDIELLRAASSTSTVGVTLVGNEIGQKIYGSAGNDVIDGKGGADTMQGYGGNDTYHVDNAKDVVIEVAGGGEDTVVASVSYTLGTGREIETLKATDTGTGTATGIKLTGNEFVNTLIGNADNNALDGKAGADTMKGGLGNDTYYVDNAGDVVVELAGEGTNDTVLASTSYTLGAGASIETLATTSVAGLEAINLTGNALAQAITGNNGANIIDGGGGSDVLRGYGDADTFVFSTALGPDNIDRIVDFKPGQDKIGLDATIFTGLAGAGWTPDAFKVISAPNAVVDADDRILYDKRTGALSYDADGSETEYDPIQFATLDNKVTLTFQDFVVI